LFCVEMMKEDRSGTARVFYPAFIVARLDVKATLDPNELCAKTGSSD
jgi:hypothetical protein